MKWPTKWIVAALMCFILDWGFAGAVFAEPPELVIYTYDSFVAKGGLGPEIFPLFEKQCKCKVRAIAVGDAGQLLTRLQLDAERDKPAAHVVVGIDQLIWARAKTLLEPWGDWIPHGYGRAYQEIKIEEGFLPFDYGVFAFMADREILDASKLEAPRRFRDLLQPQWKRNLILEDPRTSTPGLAFVLYAKALMPDFGDSGDFWSQFRSQWLTLTPGWSGAYGLFLKKQAPLVWSYTTSEAYHREQGDTSGRYRAILFAEGQPVQVEGAALVKGAFQNAEDRARARAFLEFLLTPDVQSKIPLKNWMFPVMRITPLPKSFKQLPRPKKLIRLPTDAARVNHALTEWDRVMSGVVEGGK